MQYAIIPLSKMPIGPSVISKWMTKIHGISIRKKVNFIIIKVMQHFKMLTPLSETVNPIKSILLAWSDGGWWFPIQCDQYFESASGHWIFRIFQIFFGDYGRSQDWRMLVKSPNNDTSLDTIWLGFQSRQAGQNGMAVPEIPIKKSTFRKCRSGLCS